MRRRLLPVLFLWFGFVAGAPALAEEGAKVTLQVLSTTDLHMNLMDYDYYADRPADAVGLVRTAPLIHAARAANPNSILLDNGDTIQGTPMGDWVVRERGVGPDSPHPAIQALNLLGYDAAVLGNHEFNYGLDVVTRTYGGARFPVLAGNVFKVDGDSDPANDPTLYPPYAILERTVVDQAGKQHKLRIGVLGLLTPQIVVWDRDKLEGRVTTRDVVDTARRWIPAMRQEGADVIIALAHMGISATVREGGEEHAGAYLTEVDGIDAVVTGHSHRVFPARDYQGFPGADLDKGTINGKPLVMAGFAGSHLGVITLELEATGTGWRVVDGRAEARPIVERVDNRTRPTTNPDAELTSLLGGAHQGTLGYIRRAVGRTTGPINSWFALVGDVPGLEVVAEAQRRHIRQALQGTPHASLPILSAAAPFKVGGRFGPDFYTNIPAGEIAIRNVADLYTYPNQIAAVRLTGAQIREWLEVSARVFNRIDPTRTEPQMLVNRRVPAYNFDVIDGVTYAIDLTQPERYDRDGQLINPDARRIVDLAYQGRPVADDQLFIVVTNNYRANGGGSIPGMDGSTVVYESPDTTQGAIVEYIRSAGVIEPSTNRTWRFKPIEGPVTVLYDTSPLALDQLQDWPYLRRFGPGENGFTLLQVDLSNGGAR